jgi:hypothetical protein
MILAPYFDQLGFSENEVSLYLDLAELGKASASILAKRSNMPRTTAYSVLEGLAKKGLISEEQQNATTYFSANNPKALLRLVEEKLESAKQQEKTARLLVDALSPYFTNKHFSIPRLQFFEGRSNVTTMLYDHFFQWQASIMKYDKTWWGYQDHTFVDEHQKWLQFHWANKLADEKIHLFSNRAPIEEALAGKVSNREIRPVPEEYGFSSSIWVLGDYIVLMMTRQDPQYAFQMHDAVFASNLRSVFKLLWTRTNPSADEPAFA